MRQPTVSEIIRKLELVLEGKLTREEISDWASSYIMQDMPTVEDNKVWELLQIVSGIDIKDTPEEYLHNEDDIRGWIKQFER